jgi:hypothetical protein
LVRDRLDPLIVSLANFVPATTVVELSRRPSGTDKFAERLAAFEAAKQARA